MGIHPYTQSQSATAMQYGRYKISGGIHIIIFLFLHKNICCGYSLEGPRQGAFNEYHNICFNGEIKKNSSNFLLKKKIKKASIFSPQNKNLTTTYKNYRNAQKNIHIFTVKCKNLVVFSLVIRNINSTYVWAVTFPSMVCVSYCLLQANLTLNKLITLQPTIL